jgi:hypothetical protein
MKEKPGLFHRFHVLWTPTVLVMAPDGSEQLRIEGYLPREEFRPELEMGLARVAFMAKRWDEAQKWYDHIVREHAGSQAAAEALYWRDVSQYQSTHDHTVLGRTASELKERFPDTVWAKKASVWMG